MKEAQKSKGVILLLDFIIKYWLEVAFGLVCGAMVWFVKKYMQLIKDEKGNHEKTLINTIQNKMDEQYNKTQNQMNDCYKNLFGLIEQQGKELKQVDKDMTEKIFGIQRDVLAIEGAYFRNECRNLLKEDHIITNVEFNIITVQHTAYNNLGGNHEGDALYEMVKAKHQKHLVEKGSNDNDY